MHQSFRGGYGVLKRDPFGILLPSAGALLLHAAIVVLARGLWPHVGLADWTWILVTAYIVRTALTSGFRAPLIAAAGRALDVPATGLWRTPALALVDVTVLALELVGVLAVGAPAGLIAILLTSRQLFLFAAIAVAVGVLGSAATALYVRAVFAYAPIEVILGGRGGFHALAAGVKRSRGERLQLVLLLLAGDILVALGGALCGAGALPGYPLADLALAHRWVAAAALTSRPDGGMADTGDLKSPA